MLERVGLGERLHHYPRQLSGGEQQRVALARAFVVRPKLLLADEPTGSLDADSGAEVIALLFEMNREYGTTLVLVTHDEDLATRCARIVRLAAGTDRAVRQSLADAGARLARGRAARAGRGARHRGGERHQRRRSSPTASARRWRATRTSCSARISCWWPTCPGRARPRRRSSAPACSAPRRSTSSAWRRRRESAARRRQGGDRELSVARAPAHRASASARPTRPPSAARRPARCGSRSGW